MKTTELDYIYPESLVATEPQKQLRVLVRSLSPRNGSVPDGKITEPVEQNKAQLFDHFRKGDVLVVNDTKVERRRVTTQSGLEILFLSSNAQKTEGQVLCAARDLKDGQKIAMPGSVTAELVARGLPQTLRLDRALDPAYFTEHGELALPPYIQKARGERKNRPDEEKWYQTDWARATGSQAAPTASLHFTKSDLMQLNARGVIVAPLTLHVGMGTFLPIKTDDLSEHKMHSEYVSIPSATVEQIIESKRAGHKVWALGTTVTRSLESWAQGLLTEGFTGTAGETTLFIKPGYKFEVVDCLLTNFHQPRSTLLALVSAFAGRETVLNSYQWAIAHNFKLFSYGDLTAWIK